MHAQTTPGILTVGHRGMVALAFALLAAASLAWIWVISVSTTFDPPQWARVAGSSLLPVGLVGAVVTGFLAVIVALLTKGVVYALITLALILAVQQLEGHVLQPLVMGRAVCDWIGWDLPFD